MKTLTRNHRSFRRISSFVFLLTLVFSGFDVSSASAALTSVQCSDVQGTCIDTSTPGIDLSRYDTVDSCTNGYRCLKPKAAGSGCAAPNKCETSCGGKEYYGNDAASGTCSGGQLCCKPKDACATPNGCTASVTGNAAFDQHGYIADGFCDGSGPQQCYRLAAPTTTNVDSPVIPTTTNVDSPVIPVTPSVAASSQTVSFGNPLQYDTVQGVLGGLLSALQGIIVILSIIFIVIGAVLYVTSGGNSKQVESAKSAITASMIGLAIGIAAPSFLKEISVVLGWKSASSTLSCNTGTAEDIAACNASKAALDSGISLTQILTNVLTFLTGLVGILSIIMLVIGALMILSSAGSEDRIDDGKKIVKYSIIGIVVAFAALVIVKQVAALFV